MNNVLVIAVHPDDETLGCGATLLKHKASGDNIHWMIATELLEKEGFGREIVEKREGEIEKVADMYDFDSVHRLGIPTMKVDLVNMDQLVAKISAVITKIKPNIIYFPFKSDVHSDHRCVFEAAYSCTKVFRYPFIRRIYMMETLSETEFAPGTREEQFLPNVFVNITEFLNRKIEIMEVFKSELGDHPFPRSIRNIKALATLRGATSGFEYAESFMLLKEMVD